MAEIPDIKPAPVPDNSDKRGPDLISEQQSRRASKDPASFKAAPEVKPEQGYLDTANQPSFFNLAQSAPNFGLEELVSSSIKSELKKITINGQSPEVSGGGGMSFNLSSPASASDLFSVFNGSNSRVNISPELSNFLGLGAGVQTPPTNEYASPFPTRYAPTPTTNLDSEREEYRPSMAEEARARTLKFAEEARARTLKFREKFNPESSTTDEADSTEPPAAPVRFRNTNPESDTVRSVRDGSIKDQLDYFKTNRRLPGESREEFKERKEEIKELKAAGGLDAVVDAIKNGDTSYFYKSFIPLYVTRADGNKKILIRLDNSHTTVIEGAESGERAGSLPSEDSYYLGGGGNSTKYPWDIVAYPDPNSTSNNPPYKAKIVPGTIGGILPSNYDVELDVGTGLKYAIVDCTTNGEMVTSATISFTSTFPSPISATPDKAPTSFKVCFGMVKKEANKAPEVYSFWKRSLSAVPNAAYATAPTNANDPTKYYYVWRVG